jgi:PrcB C-terminal
MSIKLSSIRIFALAAAAASLAACADIDEGIESDESDVAVASADLDAKTDQPSIPFTVVTDNAIGFAPATRTLIKTAAAYRSFFGHSAPSSVNFSTDWVVFYSAGQKNTGGYAASISNITTSLSGVSLKVTTSLSSPGSNCPVTQSLTNPKVLVKFKKQRTTGLLFYRNDTTRDCSPAPSCNTVRCTATTHCEVRVVECLVAPCPVIAGCYPNACVQTVLCTTTSHFDNTPGVCACVPNVGACNTDADCRLEDDYCTGCDCRALGPNENLPMCSGPGVRCLRQPCGGLTATCQNHRCTASPATI